MEHSTVPGTVCTSVLAGLACRQCRKRHDQNYSSCPCQFQTRLAERSNDNYVANAIGGTLVASSNCTVF